MKSIILLLLGVFVGGLTIGLSYRDIIRDQNELISTQSNDIKYLTVQRNVLMYNFQDQLDEVIEQQNYCQQIQASLGLTPTTKNIGEGD